MFTLTEVCKELSISPATGRNWIKLGKIKAEGKRGNAYVFSDEYVQRIKDELKSGDRSALKSRRNKSYISGKALYRDYISSKSVNIPIIEKLTDTLKEEDECPDILRKAIIADCAIQFGLQLQNGPKAEPNSNDESSKEINPVSYESSFLHSYLNSELDLHDYTALIDEFLDSKETLKTFLSENTSFHSYPFTYEIGEDILGLLYISLKNIGQRKKQGSYYTPNNVVKRLLGHLFEAYLMRLGQDKTILDPCCGTGNFLLQLPPGIPKENIFGCDIDEEGVLIARISLALKYKHPSASFWKNQIQVSDFLMNTLPFNRDNYDVIFGNPPWGYSYTQDEKDKLKNNFVCSAQENPESCDLFLEQAIKLLSADGIVSFVTPESLLTVKSHSVIREFVLKNTCLSHLEYIGEVFDRVQCPSIILQLKKTAAPSDGEDHQGKAFLAASPKIYDEDMCFEISSDRDVNSDCFDFLVSDEEYHLLKKLDEADGVIRLKDNAIFALGIVTGSNKDMLKSRKSKNNEIILKGSDIFRYAFKKPKCYISFKPELCQQVAPVKYYRAEEKLLYRFIGNHLVFSYDNEQTLSLNSANLVIPQLEGLDIKYICAVLNSRICEYYFRKKFRSVKVLRSHIEQLPIPSADKTVQDEIIFLVDKLISSTEDSLSVYNAVDEKLKGLYNLSDDEYTMILKEFEGENLFLI